MAIRSDIAAFAAGLYGAGERDWRVIAGAIAGLGLGQYMPAELRLAANDWVIDGARGRTFDDAAASVVVSVGRTGGVVS